MGLERSIFATSKLHTLDRLLCAVGRRMARSDFAELVGHFVMPQSHSCHLHPPVLLFFSKMHSSVPSNPCPVHLLFHWVPPCLTQRCVICTNCAAVVPTWPWGQSSAKIQLGALYERDLPPSLVLCCCLCSLGKYRLMLGACTDLRCFWQQECRAKGAPKTGLLHEKAQLENVFSIPADWQEK